MPNLQDKIMSVLPENKESKNNIKMDKKMGNYNGEVQRMGISNKKIRRRMGV
jgi:hypothetical protein